MTFTQIQTDIADRLNLTAATALARIGREINKVYREVTTEVGIHTSREAPVSAVATIGSTEVTFAGAEKLRRVWVEDSDGNPTYLTEVMTGELRQAAVSSDEPSRYAVRRIDANSVTIRMDVSAETAFNVFADALVTVSDLSGSDKPAFPESFHDILVEGVLRKEYRKLGKRDLARDSEADYVSRVASLNLHIASSVSLDMRQGKNKGRTSSLSGAIGGGGSSASLGQSALNITGAWTFNRGSGVAPFAVDDADAAYVPNLGAEFIGNVTTDRLIGRDTTGTGESEQLTVGGGVEFTGDVAKAAGGTVLTIQVDAVETAMVADDQITYAKLQNVSAASRVLGRGSASGAGNVEELTVGSGLQVVGTEISVTAGVDDANSLIAGQVFN